MNKYKYYILALILVSLLLLNGCFARGTTRGLNNYTKEFTKQLKTQEDISEIEKIPFAWAFQINFDWYYNNETIPLQLKLEQVTSSMMLKGTEIYLIGRQPYPIIVSICGARNTEELLPIAQALKDYLQNVEGVKFIEVTNVEQEDFLHFNLINGIGVYIYVEKTQDRENVFGEVKRRVDSLRQSLPMDVEIYFALRPTHIEDLVRITFDSADDRLLDRETEDAIIELIEQSSSTLEEVRTIFSHRKNEQVEMFIYTR